MSLIHRALPLKVGVSFDPEVKPWAGGRLTRSQSRVENVCLRRQACAAARLVPSSGAGSSRGGWRPHVLTIPEALGWERTLMVRAGSGRGHGWCWAPTAEDVSCGSLLKP